MRVLIADKLAERGAARLRAAGCDVVEEPGLSGDGLLEALGRVRPDVLVVRSTRVEERHAAACRSLSLVIRAGAGVNTIDVGACAARGIYVANCPGQNAVAVAELAMGLVLALDRRIPDAVAALRDGRWEKGEFSKARGVHGRRMAVIGLGDIGRAVAARARAFGMIVTAWSRSLTPEAANAQGLRYASSPAAAARDADVLSVHLALTPQTRGLVGAEVLAALADGALVINTARSEVLDHAALLDALDSRGMWAGLDVFPDEPGAKAAAYAHPLAQHPRVYGTHHIGASTTQAQDAVADAVVEIALGYDRTGRVASCVNLATASGADHSIVVRHRDRVGVLAAVLDVLRSAGLNVAEMENIVFEGGRAACARIHVHGNPGEAVVDRLDALEDVYSVAVVPLPQDRS